LKTKEAIELLENLYSISYSDSSLISTMQAYDIKLLLQQGEKYKQMWEELYEVASEFNFFPLMDRIKQKYFPKEE